MRAQGTTGRIAMKMLVGSAVLSALLIGGVPAVAFTAVQSDHGANRSQSDGERGDQSEKGRGKEPHPDREPGRDPGRDSPKGHGWGHDKSWKGEKGRAHGERMSARGRAHGERMSALGRAHGEAMRAWASCVQNHAGDESACEKPTPPGHLKKQLPKP